MKTDFYLSPLVWGTWHLAKSPQLYEDERALARFLELCFENGITSFDTADIYGSYQVEERLGKALRELRIPRENYQIITKANIVKDHPDFPQLAGILHYHSSPQYLRHAIERSLRLLGLDYLDVFLIHRVDYLLEAPRLTEVLNDYVSKGRIRHIGVSNQVPATIDYLNAYLDKKIVTNQIEFSLRHLEPLDDGSLMHSMMHAYSMMYWSPLASGTLFDDPRLMAVLKDLAQVYGLPCEGTLALAWLLRHPAAGHCVIGTNNPQRIKNYVQAAGVRLEAHDWYRILAAAGKHLP